MNFKNVAIESLAYALPDEVWTSADVEAKLAPVYERLHLPEGRLELMTGIKERRFFPAGSRASEASALAGEAVLAKSAFDRSEIDLLIHSAVCRDRLEPATAAYVHGLLGLPGKTQIFDVSNACLGFLNAMVIAASMIESGQIERALIVSGENGRPLVEHTLQQLLNPELTRKSIKPYFANLTIGAGAVGAVLCRQDLAPKSCPLVTAASRAGAPPTVIALMSLYGMPAFINASRMAKSAEVPGICTAAARPLSASGDLILGLPMMK